MRDRERRNKRALLDPAVGTKVGLVLDLEFHFSNRWVSAVTPYLINSIIEEFSCVVIRNQRDYDKFKDKLDVIISTEVGWSAPLIRYEEGKPALKYIFLSDPHRNPEDRQEYILKNSFSYILAYYYYPTYYHFKEIPSKKIIHFPWAIPDEFVSRHPVEAHGDSFILIYGASKGPAYEVRNWCKRFNFVKQAPYSGVENKVLSDKEYFKWLRTFDAAIAAGSLDSNYRLVVPKYFEIAAAGCLLFAQEAEDLDILGFRDGDTCIVFNKENFEEKAIAYLKNRESYIPLRERGRQLIWDMHTVSKRVTSLKRHISNALKAGAYQDLRW